jgi:anaerobic magnesium-protoporphyrin IX monomethyl ester cyclase
MEHLYETFDGTFLWFTDDNFEYRKRAEKLYDELKKRRFIDDVNWFFQARTDDIAAHPDLVSKLREVGNNWVLIGVENNSPQLLKDFNKKIKVSEAYQAVKILNRNNVFAQSMFIIGSRKDTKESIEELRRFSLDLGTDLAIYTVLTPFPGTKTYEDALRNNWIEDTNLAHYDMAHAIMPTETLSREMVQEELYECYRRFYGSISRNLAGIFSKNPIKRRAYRHMAGKNVLRKLRRMI